MWSHVFLGHGVVLIDVIHSVQAYESSTIVLFR